MGGENLANCPVCGGDFAAEAGRCASCGTDLSAFSALIDRAREELNLARLALARGDGAEVERRCRAALGFWEGCAADVAALRTKSAIDGGEFELAYDRLTEMREGTEKSKLATELRLGEEKSLAAAERFNIALTCARKAQFREAAEQLESALELAPGMAPAYRLLAKVYISLGENEPARAAIARGLARFENDRELLELEEMSSGAPARQKKRGFADADTGSFVAPLLFAQTVILAVILILLVLLLFSPR